jgi:hypothetical protein
MDANVTEKKRLQGIINLENKFYPNVFLTRLSYLWKNDFLLNRIP